MNATTSATTATQDGLPRAAGVTRMGGWCVLRRGVYTTPMTNSTSPHTSPRTCYAIDYRSAVHGSPVVELVYATSPAAALDQFNQDGPAVDVLAVRGRIGEEYAVVNGEIAAVEDVGPIAPVRRPGRFAPRSRVLVVQQGHPHFAKVATVTEDEGDRLVGARLDGATFATVIARGALVQTTR